MNNISRYGFESILKRTYYILIVCKINVELLHTLIRITALDSVLKQTFPKEIISV